MGSVRGATSRHSTTRKSAVTLRACVRPTFTALLQGARHNIIHFLSLFEHKVREQATLTRHEVNAITAFLTSRVKPFFIFEGATSQLRQLIALSTVFDWDDLADKSSNSSVDSEALLFLVDDATVAPGDKVADETVLYKRGAECSTFSLVLQGHIGVWAGEDAFHSDVGPWSTLGDRALSAGTYCPDFSAITNGPCRVLQIDRAAFAVEAARARKAKAALEAGAPRTRLNKTTRTASLLRASNDSAAISRSPMLHTSAAQVLSPNLSRNGSAARTHTITSVEQYPTVAHESPAADRHHPPHLISSRHTSTGAYDSHTAAWQASGPRAAAASAAALLEASALQASTASGATSPSGCAQVERVASGDADLKRANSGSGGGALQGTGTEQGGVPCRMPVTGWSNTACSERHGMKQTIVIVGEGGKPMCIEEGEVRDLLLQSPHSTADSTRRKGARGQEGMALAMVRGSASRNGIPFFRALTSAEAMQTSTAGRLLHSNNASAVEMPAGTSVLMETVTQE